jgi:hypothetical protein
LKICYDPKAGVLRNLGGIADCDALIFVETAATTKRASELRSMVALAKLIILECLSKGCQTACRRDPLLKAEKTKTYWLTNGAREPNLGKVKGEC